MCPKCVNAIAAHRSGKIRHIFLKENEKNRRIVELFTGDGDYMISTLAKNLLEGFTIFEDLGGGTSASSAPPPNTEHSSVLEMFGQTGQQSVINNDNGDVFDEEQDDVEPGNSIPADDVEDSEQ